MVEICKHIGHFKHLTTLHLNGSLSLIGFPIVETLAHITDTRLMLKHLDISNSADGDWLAKVVARCPMFAGLKFLDLSSSNMTEAGMQTLIDSPHLGNLEILRLARNKIPKLPATATFPGAACLSGLKLLDIRCNSKSGAIFPYLPSIMSQVHFSTTVILAW